MEAVEPDIMERNPKPKNEGIFAHGLGLRVVLQGLMFAVLTLIGFKVGENFTGTLAGGQTMAFITLSLSQVIQAYNMRSEHSLFKIGVFSNQYLCSFSNAINNILSQLIKAASNVIPNIAATFNFIVLNVHLYFYQRKKGAGIFKYSDTGSQP